MLERAVVLGAETPSGQLIAKKLRMEQYAVRMLPSGASLEGVRDLHPAGIILAGEESEGAKPPELGILSLGVPVLSLGFSSRALLSALGAGVSGKAVRETVMPTRFMESPLFGKAAASERWVSLAEPYETPEGYAVIAESEGFPLAYRADQKDIFLLQFQIERNDPDGMEMLLSFMDGICGCTRWWTTEWILRCAEERILESVGGGRAICLISGGLDSSVAAVLAGRALGDRACCAFVDTGLMREGEADAAERFFRDVLTVDFERLDASGPILGALRGVFSAREKAELVQREVARALGEKAEKTPGEIVFIKGTHYADLLRGGSLWDERLGGWPIVEPFQELFKEEVKHLGEALGLSREVLDRQPFPGIGLAARIRGEVTESRLQTLRRATVLFSEEMQTAGLNRRLSRFFAMLDALGDTDVIILRATQGHEPGMSAARLPYDLLERVTERMMKELPGISRVLYDITPGMAEWS